MSTYLVGVIVAIMIVIILLSRQLKINCGDFIACYCCILSSWTILVIILLVKLIYYFKS